MVRSSRSPTSEICALTSHMVAASEALVADRNLLRRRDWKFLTRTERVPEILAAMGQSHAILMSGNKTVARYATSYFDSPDLRSFHDHRRGRARRLKVRVREYRDRGLQMLEVKKRTAGGVTDKTRQPHACAPQGLDPGARAFLQERVDRPVDAFVPVLDNQFHRIGLLALHAQERVTIDMDLSFTRGDATVSLDGLAVVEVKSAEARYRTPTLQILKTLGLRPGSFSKYCVGTVLLRPEERAHALAPVLRRMGRVLGSQP